MSFTDKIGVLELLIDLLHEHENSLDTLIEKLEIVESTVKNSPISEKAIEYEGTLLEDKYYKGILVVDDDRDLAKTFELILNEAGFGVELAFTGLEAIQKMYRKEYDLVILDINLPDMLGTMVSEKMESICENTEYIYITGYSGLKEDVASSGEPHVYSKPIEPEKLVEITSSQMKTETRVR